MTFTRAPLVSTPGQRRSVLAGRSFSRTGNVTGSFPEGVASPNSSRATIAPSSCPGNHASSTAGTAPSHGVRDDELSFRTTTVRGFAAAIARISESCPFSSAMLSRSRPSSAIVPASTIATSAPRAAATASARFARSSATTVSVAVAGDFSCASTCFTPSSGVTVANGITSELPPQQHRDGLRRVLRLADQRDGTK